MRVVAALEMIVKESPTPTKTRNDTTWPPRSPLDVSLSSPSRLKKLHNRNVRNSVSPSPSKPVASKLQQMEDEGMSEEEDEETLQLQLEAIKARLKLKKLQKARGSQPSPSVSAPNTLVRSEQASSSSNTQSQKQAIVDDLFQRSNVEVPHSPSRKARHTQPPESPRRVQLGIDKGLKASEVSLERASPNGQLSKRLSHQPLSTQSSLISRSDRSIPQSRSFSDRLADARSQDIKREENQLRRQKSCSKGFGATENFLNGGGSLNRTLVDKNKENRSRPSNSKQATSNSNDIVRSKSDPAARVRNRRAYNESLNTRDGDVTDEKDLDYDSYSRFHLAKRITTQSKLSQVFEGKTLVSIPKLLKTVTAPGYDPPDVDNDYVIFGIIASKSTPLDHVDKTKVNGNGDPDDPKNSRSKFMSIRLTDLEWEVNLFLFDSAFESFWRLTVGTVIAILNPDIMPPKPHMRDTGQFSLKLSSSEDTVLEIGSAKDLGFCKSVKRDGKECGQWVDRRKTEFCEFHVSLKADKAKAGRMEINGMAGLDLFGGNKTGKGARGRKSAWRGGKSGNKEEEETKGAYYDFEAHEVAYGIPSSFNRGKSTADMLDQEDYAQGGLNKDERSRRRLAAQEKEHDLARKLGSLGSGLGGEYMRLKRPELNDAEHEAPEPAEDPQDAQSLGLVRRSADIKLNYASGRPQKDTHEAVGWSHAFKRGLPSPTRDRSPEKIKKTKADNRSPSPSKKARFLLQDKGLRIPGRESLPGLNDDLDENDDDDDLDIV